MLSGQQPGNKNTQVMGSTWVPVLRIVFSTCILSQFSDRDNCVNFTVE